MNVNARRIFLLMLLVAGMNDTMNAQYYPEPGNTPVKFEDLAKQYEAEHGRNKQFERWYWYWNMHTDANGYMVPTSRNFDEWQKLQANGYHAKTTATQANWHEMGPFDNYGVSLSGVGRINNLAFHPTDANTIWAASASGGLWKTINNGADWVSLTDNLPVLGTSDIDVNPKNPNTLYLCTGDRDAYATHSVGVLKSTDGGNTWKQTGLQFNPSQLKLTNALLINRIDTNSLTLGTNDGIYKSYNGGTTWSNVFSMPARFLVYHPTDTNIIYAAGTYGRIHRSANGGKTWTTVLQPSVGGAVNLAITPANPAMVRAIITGIGNGLQAVYGSQDTGKTFTVIYTPPNCAGDLLGSGNSCGTQGGYNLSLCISPTNPNEMYVGGVALFRSVNGGMSWVNSNAYVHPDHHFLGFHPLTPGRLYSGNDGGITYSDNPAQGQAWITANNGLAVTQFYSVATVPGASLVVGGTQDNGTETIQGGVWDSPMGGDGLACVTDPTDSNTYYSVLQYGNLFRFDNHVSKYIKVNNPGGPSVWFWPLAINPHDTKELVTAYLNTVYYTMNKGDSWSTLGYLTTGNIKGLAISPADAATLYGFLQDAVIYTNSFNPPAQVSFQKLTPPFTGNISNMALDAKDKDHFWISYSGYGGPQVAEYNAGNWKQVNTGLPDVPVLCIAADKETNVLYAGTSIGVFYLDSVKNATWKPYNTNMPAVAVNSLDIHYSSGTIWAGTYGRGMWRSAKEYSTAVATQAQPRTRLAIFPNPNRGQFTIQGSAQLAAKPAIVRIADYTGKQLIKQNVRFDAGGSITIDRQNLAPGIYIVEVLVNNALIAHEKMAVE